MKRPGQSLIFAHRGANREAAENTRSAFDRALAYPIDGIETDVQLSRDEVAVLWHDRFLDKVGLPGRHIDDFDYAQLRTMDFAREGTSEGIMSLQEFLDAYRKRCRLLVEIKNRGWEDRARHEIKTRQVLSMIGAVAGEMILVSSFNLGSLVYAHRHAPSFPLVLNLEPEHDADFAQHILIEHPFLHGLCVHVATLNGKMADVLRQAGKCLAVYTCNSNEEVGNALDLGVDILISDVPQKALQMRDG